MIGGFALGYRLCQQRTTDYKTRWIEANQLLQQERLGTANLNSLEEKLDDKYTQTEWRIVRERIKINFLPHLRFSVTNGKESIPVRDVWEGGFGFIEDCKKTMKDCKTLIATLEGNES